MKILFAKGITNLFVLTLLHFTLIYMTGQKILTSEFYENSGQPLGADTNRSFALLQSLQTWIYFTDAIYLLIKLITITIILQTGLYLINNYVNFCQVLNMVILSEFIFVFPATLKIVTFPYTHPHGTLLDWHRYYILSAISIFQTAPADWSYALQSFNAFEILYLFLLAFGITRISDLTFDSSLRVVLISYVPALLVWIAAVTFFTLIMFPANS